MPDSHDHESTCDPPTADRTDPHGGGVAADPLVSRLLDMVQGQLERQSRMMKWSFGLTIVCLVTIVALSGANLAVNTGLLNVSTTGAMVTDPSPPAATDGFSHDTGWLPSRDPLVQPDEPP